jgi:hypothetical protein
MLLEVFNILFTSDAKKTKDDTDKLNKSLTTSEQLSNKLGSSLGKTIGKLAGAAAAFLSVGALVSSLKASVAYVDQLDKTSRALNVSVKDLDAWGNAVERLGGNAQAFQQSLYLTNTRLNMMGRGSESATEELLKLSSTFEKLSNSKSYQLGRKLGLDESTILLLQKGKRSVNELINKQKEYNTITAKDTEIVRKFKEQLFDTKRAFSGVSESINSFILPALSWVARKFEDAGKFIKDNKGFIEGAMIAIGGAITVFLLPPLISAAAASIALNAPLYGLIAIAALISTVFALAYDDIRAFNEGFDSMYGRLVKQAPVIHDTVLSLGDSWKRFMDGLYVTGDVVNEVLSSLGKFLIDEIKYAIEYIEYVIEKMSSLYKKVTSVFGNRNSDLKATVNHEFGSKSNLLAGKNTLDAINSYPITSGFSGGFGNTTSSNKNINFTTGNITIETQATDPDDIAKQFGKSMKQEVEQAFGSYTDGVLA